MMSSTFARFRWDKRCINCIATCETVLTPFMGIGSEAYQAIKFGRKAIGIELKESYFRIAVKNIESVERETKTLDLFSWAEMQQRAEEQA
jgi:tRNA G10  N-methylase Trm11